MSKFCQNCGEKLDDNAVFCRTCGYQVSNNLENQQVQQTQTQQQVQYQQPIQQVQEVNYNQGYYQQQNANPVPKKKSKKKPIIISVIAVVLVAVLAFGGFTLYGKLFGNVDDNGKFIVVNQGDKDIYFGFKPMALNQDGTVENIDTVNGSEKVNMAYTISPYYSVYDNDTIYYYAHGTLNKLTYSDGKLHDSTWVDEDVIKNNETLYSKEDSTPYYNVFNLQSYDEYVYFNTFSYENTPESLKKLYKIGKISKDGKSIEMLSDNIHASDYTISDGWIYYFDNGYTYSSNDKVTGSDFDQDRMGIYRAKEDGSEIEKLYSNIEKSNDVENDMNWICSDMKVIDDYIYFIDSSRTGNGKICRINKDGSGYQKISDNSAFSYIINKENNTMYYVSGPSNRNDYDRNFKGEIYEKQLGGDKSEKELMKPIAYTCWLQYYDDCLYVSSAYFSFDNAGQRYNFKKGKMEVIHGEQVMTEQEKIWSKMDSFDNYSNPPKFEWVDDFTETETED